MADNWSNSTSMNYEILSDAYANWPVEKPVPDDERHDIVKTLLALADIVSTASRYPDNRFYSYLKDAFGDEMKNLRISVIDDIRYEAMWILLKRIVDFYESGRASMLFNRIRAWEIRDT